MGRFKSILDFSNKGLEELINLERLNCNRNNISELNFNIKLELLICDNNNLLIYRN